MRFLVTDVLLWGVLGAAIVYTLYARRHEHLRAPWREVMRRPLGMSAAVVLLAFVAIGLLDSVRLAGDDAADVAASARESPLDRLLAPLLAGTETSYSAPFALYGYAKETATLADGRTVRDYPRLRHGGVHLASASQRPRDVFLRGARGLAVAAGVWMPASLLSLWIAARRARRPLVGQLRQAWRGHGRLPWRSALGTVGALCAAIGIVAALAPHYHVLGTDKVGNDVLYQSLKGVRTGLVIGTLTTFIALPFALALGLLAGYFRGWVDDLVQYLYTTLSSIPAVLLIAAAALMLDVHMARHAADFESPATRADLRLLALCVILGVTSWTSLCRLLRAEALKLRESDFVSAARALGTGHATLLLRHLVPNVLHLVLISVVLDFSGLVLAEAALTYIDIGVDPSMESWGNMINGARLELARQPPVWWSLIAAFGFMFALVLVANLFADAVRDAFDPRLRIALA